MHCMSAVYDAQISINKVSWKNRVARPQIGSNGKNAGSPVRMVRSPPPVVHKTYCSLQDRATTAAVPLMPTVFSNRRTLNSQHGTGYSLRL